MYAANRTRHGRIVRKAAMVRTHPLNRQRVAWWLALPGLNGGGTWHDLAGNHDGTLTSFSGQPWQATRRGGGWGQLQFNGTSSYVDTGNPLTGFTGTAAASVACWAYTATTGVYCALGDNNNNATSIDREGIAIFNNSGVFWCRMNCGGTDVTASGGTWTAGVTYRVVVTYDGATVRIYANGVQQGSAAGSGVIFTSGANLRLGVRGNYGISGGGPWWWPGTLDDVSLWSRALTADEVLLDYNLSRVGYPGVLARDDQATWAALYSGGAAPPATIWPWWINSGAALGSGIN